MTWASEMMKAKPKTKHMINETTRVAYALGHNQMKHDLAQSVLEKNKEIDKDFTEFTNENVKKKRILNGQARAFRELCEEMKKVVKKNV